MLIYDIVNKGQNLILLINYLLEFKGSKWGRWEMPIKEYDA